MLAGAAHAAIAAPADSSKTPEQVGELYLMVGMGNAGKATELADYLQLEGQPRNKLIAFASGVRRQWYDEIYTMWKEAGITGEPVAADQSARILAQALISGLFQRSTCHATDSAIHAGDGGARRLLLSLTNASFPM